MGVKASNTAATTAAVTNRIVASANMKVGAYTIANASPVWAGGALITVGKGLFGEAITETITPLDGTVATSTNVFRSVTSATGAGWVINTGNDTIVVGVAAGNIVATGGGMLRSVVTNNSVAAAITVSDCAGTITTIPASQAAGTQYIYDVPWSGYLKVATTSTNDVTVIHTVGVPTS